MATKNFTANVELTQCVTISENLKGANSTVTGWLREQKKLPSVVALMWQHRDTLLAPLCEVVDGLTPDVSKNMFHKLVTSQLDHLNAAMYGACAEEGQPEYEVTVGYWGAKNVGKYMKWTKGSVEYKVSCALLDAEGARTKVPVWRAVKKDSWSVSLLWKVLCQSYTLNNATAEDLAPAELPELTEDMTENLTSAFEAVGCDEGTEVEIAAA